MTAPLAGPDRLVAKLAPTFRGAKQSGLWPRRGLECFKEYPRSHGAGSPLALPARAFPGVYAMGALVLLRGKLCLLEAVQ